VYVGFVSFLDGHGTSNQFSGPTPASDTLPPVTKGGYLAVQFSSSLGVPAVILIARRVLIAERLR